MNTGADRFPRGVVLLHAQCTSANRPSPSAAVATVARTAKRGTGRGGRWHVAGRARLGAAFEAGRWHRRCCSSWRMEALPKALRVPCSRVARGSRGQRGVSCHGSSWTDRRGAGQRSWAQAKKFASSGRVTCPWLVPTNDPRPVRIVFRDGVAVVRHEHPGQAKTCDSPGRSRPRPAFAGGNRRRVRATARVSRRAIGRARAELRRWGTGSRTSSYCTSR
jgi:hypothetical protein